MQSDKTTIVLGAFSAATVLIAWIFRYKIAELAKGRHKAPAEVLFEGYEKLLKSYQDAILDRDGKIEKLEADFDHIQDDLNKARQTIGDMRIEDQRKARIIKDLELKLGELKIEHKRGNL